MSDLYDSETDGAIGFCISNDIKYYKSQIDNCRDSLEEPEYESTDDYLCRCDAVRNYYEKKNELKHMYGVDYV